MRFCTMKTVASTLVSLLAFATIAQTALKEAPDRIWIADVTIVSPERLDQIEKGSVLIENGRIARVERGEGVKTPDGARAISAKGEYLIPGLIDSHVHQ
jgi:imidazolonepropionase-like amidohydrolase